MPRTQNQTATLQTVEISWSSLASRWLPAWLDACNFPAAAAELRTCPPPRLRRVVDQLFISMQDQLLTAMDTHIPLADELCEPIAVTVASEYIQASLPGPWLALVREGATAGRVALVAQMGLFVELLAMAAEPEPADPERLSIACSRAEGVLLAGQEMRKSIDLR